MPAGTPSYGRFERYAGDAPVESTGASAAGVPIILHAGGSVAAARLKADAPQIPGMRR